MAVCPRPNNCGLSDKLCGSWGPYFSWERCAASACYLVAEWPLELDIRRELAPFELNLRSSCLTTRHTSISS